MDDKRKIINALNSRKQEKIEEVFNYIYDKYKPLAIFVAGKYLKSVDDIDDVVQDAFISFFNNINNVNTNVKSYLTTIVKNKAIDFIRKNKRIEYVDVEDFDVISDYEKTSNDSLTEMISNMRSVLGDLDTNIILLHLVDDLKFDDIALKLNMNTKTIKTKYYRALKKYQERKKENEKN